MKKISVIMPSYNDAVSIVETLDSLIEQNYTNWELVIIDDGSTDNTKEMIQKYKEEKDRENKITYLYQQNADQLNAILNGLDHTDGDFIFILHSDDLINEKDSFTKCVAYMEEHPEITEIIGDLTTIDENSNYTGMQRVNDYKKEHYVLPLQLLWLGRNLFIDVAFHRRETFIKKVKENYVKWNTPFWMNFKAKESIEMLNVKKVDFSFYKYRIFSGNYVNSYKGKLNVINGELRTLVGLMKFYNIPAYRFQYLVYRTFNKLGLFNLYRPIYQKKEQQEKGAVVE
ncbi:MAG: glycosyltransferase, partial [Clostridia bacterium]